MEMEDEEIGSTDHFYFGPGLPPLRTSPGQHSLETRSRSQRRPLTTRAKYILQIRSYFYGLHVITIV